MRYSWKDEGLKMSQDDIQYFADKRSPESKAAAEQRMQEYKEGRAKSMEDFKTNMQKISDAHDAKIKEISSKPKSTGGGGGGAGIPKVGPKKPMDMAKGGKVSSASKRADGCAVKGKTKGRIV
jgi:hypothetical protein